MSSSSTVETRSPTQPSTLPPADKNPSRRRRFLGGLLVGLLVSSIAGGAVLWNQHKYRFIAKRWGVVVPGKIYRSGQVSQWMLPKTFKEHGIAAVVDLQLNDVHDEHQQAEIQYAQANGIAYHRCALGGDGTGELTNYADAVAILVQCVKENRPVVVHCSAGAQRTGGVVAFYRLLVERASPEAVYEELKSYGWEPEEDLELLPYINTRLPELAAMLVERGVISELPDAFPKLGG